MYDFLFSVPRHLETAFETGKLHRFGALLKDAQTGRIVAHLQETGLGQKLMSTAFSTVTAVNPVSSFGFGVVQVIQNEQIKHALATLQTLQIGNLLLSGVGIGISAAGFAVTTAKLNKVQAGVARLEGAVERLTRDMDLRNEDRLDRDLARLDTACRQVDEAWLLTNPEEQWRDAARALHERQGDLYIMAMRARDRQGPGADLFALLVEAWLLAGATRITARLASDEIPAALAATREMVQASTKLTGSIDASDLLPPSASGPFKRDPEQKSKVEAARQRVLDFREREELVESKIPLLIHLTGRGQSGRDYLETLRNADAPLLLLPTAAA